MIPGPLFYFRMILIFKISFLLANPSPLPFRNSSSILLLC